MNTDLKSDTDEASNKFIIVTNFQVKFLTRFAGLLT